LITSGIMSLVFVLYALMAIQGIILLLHFMGKGFILSLALEVALVSLKTLHSIFLSGLKWILPPRRKNLRGELALITGAASGIGRLMSLRLAEKGCELVIWDLNEDGLEAVGKEIRSIGGTVYCYKCNLCDKNEIRETAKKVKEEAGEISLLINNAGIVTGRKFMDCTDEAIVATFDVNSMSHFWTIREFLPEMRKRNHGHIVGIASIAGLVGLVGAVDYCASKFAVVGLMESLRRELLSSGVNGIQFTTVCPSVITTGMFEGVKFRFPKLVGFAYLTPEYAAAKIVDAIEKNQVILAMPRGAYFAVALQHILPTNVTDLLLKFLGADDAMKTFIGRKDKNPEM